MNRRAGVLPPRQEVIARLSRLLVSAAAIFLLQDAHCRAGEVSSGSGVDSTGHLAVTAAVKPLYKTFVAFPGNLDNKFASDLLDSITFNAQGKAFSVLLQSRGQTVYQIDNVDLKMFLPRMTIPEEFSEIGDYLTSIEELHRKELRFWDLSSRKILALANNCLPGGFWEIAVKQYDVSGYEVDLFHGSFILGREQYLSLLAAAFGESCDDKLVLTDSAKPLASGRLDLTKQRRVIDERVIFAENLEQHLNEPLPQFMEQERKRKHVQPRIPNTLRDLYDRSKEVRLTEFISPGLYSANSARSFDFSYLKDPVKALARLVSSTADNSHRLEFAVFLRDGRELLVTGLKPEVFETAVLDNRIGPSSLIKLGFGYKNLASVAWYQDRLLDYRDYGAPLVLLMDEQAKIADNQAAGLDEVWIECISGRSPLMRLYLLSYERQLVVAHWSFVLPPGFLKTGTDRFKSAPVYRAFDEQLSFRNMSSIETDTKTNK